MVIHPVRGLYREILGIELAEPLAMYRSFFAFVYEYRWICASAGRHGRRISAWFSRTSGNKRGWSAMVCR